jgi:hypothetical protein
MVMMFAERMATTVKSPSTTVIVRVPLAVYIAVT